MAALIVLLLYAFAGTRFSTSAEVAIDGGASVDAIEARLLPPGRLTVVANRLGLPARLRERDDSDEVAEARAASWLRAHLHVTPTDLTGVVSIGYRGPLASVGAPAVNGIAADVVRDERAQGRGAAVTSPAQDVWLPEGSQLLPLAAALAAAALAAGLALLVREARAPGLRGPEQAERLFGVPVVAMTPAIDGLDPGDRARLIDLPVIAPDSEYARAFSRWLARVGPKGASLAVCSSLASEGKSTSAIALARTAALAGRRVVLIDGDARARAVSRVFGADRRPGLVELVRGEATLDEALGADGPTTLSVIGNSRAETIAHLMDPRSVAQLHAVMQALIERFDLVLIDTPPLLALAEAVEMAGAADEVLFVTRWRRTPLPAIRQALAMLHRRGIAASLMLTMVRFALPEHRAEPARHRAPVRHAA